MIERNSFQEFCIFAQNYDMLVKENQKALSFFIKSNSFHYLFEIKS